MRLEGNCYLLVGRGAGEFCVRHMGRGWGYFITCFDLFCLGVRVFSLNWYL